MTYIASSILLSGVVLVIVAAILIFEIVMFIHAIRNKRISDNARILWAIGMLLVHPIVAVVYYFTDYKR